MSNRHRPAFRKPSDHFFRLKPLVAGVRVVITGGLFVGSVAPVQAELPVPGVPTELSGTGAPLPWVSSGSADLATNGHTMNINQHSEKAILNWQSFNVGSDNSVQFVQPDSAAVALNRIYDNNPSQILGHVAANGQIYLVNQNGFVFGKDSVVDTNSTVVSTLNVSNDVFLNSNIADAYNSKGVAALEGKLNPNGNSAPGTITVANGAQIKAGQGGRIILAGAEVENDGSLSADTQGQILVVASQDKVYLQANNPKNGSAWNGLLVEVGTGGKITNSGTGSISVRQGNVTLAGFAVNQNGRVSATTSVNVNGSIRLQAAEGLGSNPSKTSLDNLTPVITPASTTRGSEKAQLTFGSGSLTQISPDSDGATIDDTTAATAKPQSIIEAMADTVEMQANSAIVAPGAKVTITATGNPSDPTNQANSHEGRIFIDKQAVIDVSGIQNVAVAADRNVAQISVQSYELRNSPLQLTGVLKGQTVQADTALNTTIIDTKTAAAAIQRGIEERMTAGGQINLNSSGDILVNNGAKLSIAGGSVAYQSGIVNTTKLIDQYGHVVDISQADPNMQYVGIFGVVTEEHTKWGVTQTWNLDQSQGQYRTGYMQGANAGAVDITAPLVFWNGELAAGGISGLYQRDLNLTPSGGGFSIDTTYFNSGTSQFQDVTLQAGNAQANFSLNDKLPTQSGKVANLVVDTSKLSSSGVQQVSIKTFENLTLADGTAFALAAGGGLSAQAGNIDVYGHILAAGGNVSLKAVGNSFYQGNNDVTLAGNSLLDVSGRWINDQVGAQAGTLPTDPLYIKGGNVTVMADNAVTMAKGSAINADGGALFSANGKLTSGSAGKIDLESGGLSGGKLQLGGTLSAYGLAQGGSLTLANNNIIVGSAGLNDPSSALVLGVNNGNFDFAPQSGFSSITLKGNGGSNTGNVTVKSGVALNLMTENLLLQGSFQNKATGSSIRDFSRVDFLPENMRQAVQFSLAGGDSAMTLEAGSSIRVDKSTLTTASAINLSSQGSIFADGTLIAPGGQINLSISPDKAGFYDPTQAVWLGQHARLSATGDTRLDPANGLGLVTGNVLNGGTVSIDAKRGYAVLEKGSSIDVSGTHAPLVISKQSTSGAGISFTSTDIGSDAGSISISAAEGAVLDGDLKGFAGSASNRAGSLVLAADNSDIGRSIVQGDINYSSYPHGLETINVVQASGQSLPAGAKFGDNLDQKNLHGRMTVSADKVMAGGFADFSLQLPEINLGNSGQVTFTGNVALNVAGHLTIDSPVINWAPANGESIGSVSLSSPYLTLGSSSARTVSGSAVSGGGQFSANAQWMQLQGASLWNGFNNVTLNSAHDLRTIGELLQKRDFLGEMVTAGDINLQASQIYPATLTNFTFKTTGAGRAINISGTNTDVSPLSAGGSLTFQAAVINQAGVLKAPLGSISLIATQSLALENGSVTSVSAAGQLIPYGVVQGGLDWLYPIDALGNNLVVSAPPTKQVNLNAPVIDLAKGSTVDISGGGDLFSSEFKPVSSDFPNFLLPGSQSYDHSFAVIPSLGSALAPYDPNFMSTWNDPKTGTNYALGSQVYLNGTADLPAGSYTILPAYYALLPGAYLITPQSNSLDSSVTTYSTSGLPIVSGYEMLAGSAVRDSRTSAFQVETSAQLLQNHPQYAVYCAGNCDSTVSQQETLLKSNNQAILAANLASSMNYLNTQSLLSENFYANKAQANATAIPLLPADSGQISISAQTSLTLDGMIDAAAPGGRGARMDIAADNIEVVSSLSGTPSANTLQILDSSLNNLKVASLFLGGSRTSNENIYSLAAPASSGDNTLTLSSTVGWAKGDYLSGAGVPDGAYIVSISGNTVTLNNPLTADIAAGSLINDSNSARLNGATNLFVTSKQVTFDSGVQLNMTDLVAAATDSVAVKAGASLAASGTVTTGDKMFNLIGDSALLRLSADQQVGVNRTYYAGAAGATGQLTVESGATLYASKAMLLDSSNSTRMDGNIVMKGGSLSLGAGNINIGAVSDAAKLNALNLTNQQLAGLNVDQLILNSKQTVNFYGEVGQVDGSGNPTAKPLTFKDLVINAGGISGYGNADQMVRLQADNLLLQNLADVSGGAGGNGLGQLAIAAGNYTQGTGNFAFNGFSAVNLNVSNGFTVNGSSNMNVAADMNLGASYLTATSGSKLTLDASGHALNINGNSGAAGPVSSGLGGVMSFTGNSVVFDSRAVLPSGKLTLHANGSGDVRIGPSANIDLAGRSVAFANSFDYTPGGTLTVSADNGSVAIDGGSQLALSGAGSAAGGTLVVNAVKQSVNIADNAVIHAAGGSAKFDVSGFNPTGSSFDQLMAALGTAGISEAIDFRVRSADISSSTAINANTVTLSADQGKVDIHGNITANAGGAINIYAGDTITLESGSHLTAANSAGKGGQVLLSSLAPISATGSIVLKSGSSIDVHGSSSDPSIDGGLVTLRSLQDGTGINLHHLDGTVAGYSSLIAEAVRVYSNADFRTAGTIESGFISDIQTNTQNYMATADISNIANGSNFVNGAMSLKAGVEIDYAGDLTLQLAKSTDKWDLSGWRYSGNPGDLTIRASGSLTFNNSLTDGFKSGNLAGVAVYDQLMNDKSWSYTLSAGADLASSDINRVSGLQNNLTVGYQDTIDAQHAQVQVRTGTGNMQLNAGGNITIHGNGTVYSAGQQSAQNPYGSITDYEASHIFYAEYPLNGGNLRLSAGGNITGGASYNYDGSINDFNTWMQRIAKDNTQTATQFTPTAWGIAFGYANFRTQVLSNTTAPAFRQNIGSFGGGNVSIQAAGDITNLEVAMPTTGKPVGHNNNTGTGLLNNFSSNVIDVQGGGTMQVDAGGSISGGSYYLGKGTANLSAGGLVAASPEWTNGPKLYSGDTQFNVNAVQGVQIAGVTDPMISAIGHTKTDKNALNKQVTKQPVSFFSYTDASSVAIRSMAGDVTFSGGGLDLASTFPGSMQVSAFGGSVVLNNDINLFPSATGQLHVYAQQDIRSSDPNKPNRLTMSDYAPNASAQPLPTMYTPNTPVVDLTMHAADASNTPLHLNDLQPASFVTLSGDIKDLIINTPKLTTIKAGNDISNADITIQNIHNSDVSIIDAGRDLSYPVQLSPNTGKVISAGTPPKIEVAGPGDLLVKTGRNLDLGVSTGLMTVGDKNVVINGEALTNSALIRPSYVSSAVIGTDSNLLTLKSAKGLVVGEKLIGQGLAANTIITAISGNTVTLSSKPVSAISTDMVFQTADTSAGYFTQMGAGTDSNQLILTDTSGLLVGEQLTAKGLAANTVITAIDGNTVTLSAKPIQPIDSGALILQTTQGAPGSYLADVNTGANVTVLAGLQGALPDYLGFLNSDQQLEAYIDKLQLMEANANSSELSAIYQKTIAQYQNLEGQFITSKQQATDLITQFMQQQSGNGSMNSSDALKEFATLLADKSSVDKTLPIQAQLNSLLLPVLINEIKINGSASAADKTLGNEQGYAAINAFFPGANWKGDVNLIFSTLQTQRGGDINLLVPGGKVNAGLAVVVGLSTPRSADQLGIIAKESGSINAIAHDDFMVNTSRVIAMNGDDLIWSSYGNIDAGKGAKSAHSNPPLEANYVNGNLVYTLSSSVSGSGIRAPIGDISLFAPKGVVNAAEAGIGGKNVTIAATAVLGAQNISFSGTGTGVPQATTGSVAAGLTGTSNVTANVSQMAESSVSASTNNDKAGMKNAVLGMLSVEVLGFGE